MRTSKGDGNLGQCQSEGSRAEAILSTRVDSTLWRHRARKVVFYGDKVAGRLLPEVPV